MGKFEREGILYVKPLLPSSVTGDSEDSTGFVDLSKVCEREGMALVGNDSPILCFLNHYNKF